MRRFDNRTRLHHTENLEDRRLMAADVLELITPVMVDDSSALVAVGDLQETTIDGNSSQTGSGASGVGYPAPDDDEDYGPLGPIVRDALRIVAHDFVDRMFFDSRVAFRQGDAGQPSPDDDTPWPPGIGPLIKSADELYIAVALAARTVNPDPTPWNPELFHELAQNQLLNWFSEADRDAGVAISPALAGELGYPAEDGGDLGPIGPWARNLAGRLTERMHEDVQIAYRQGATGKPADDDDSPVPPWIGPYVRTVDDLYVVVATHAFRELNQDSTVGQFRDQVEELLFRWFRDPDDNFVIQAGAVINRHDLLHDAVESTGLAIQASRPGDSNRDGVFDSSDLVQVFQAGEYADGIANNSTFEEGDWNDDGEFDSADLVLAFQLGHFNEPRESTPDPREIDLIFAQDEDSPDLREL